MLAGTNKQKLHGKPDNHRGATLIEFVPISLFLMVYLVGFVDLCMFLYHYSQLTSKLTEVTRTMATQVEATSCSDLLSNADKLAKNEILPLFPGLVFVPTNATTYIDSDFDFELLKISTDWKVDCFVCQLWTGALTVRVTTAHIMEHNCAP